MDPTPIITAIATVALAVITGMYTSQMKKSVKVMENHVEITKDILKTNNTPEVILFLNLRRDRRIQLCVENIGTGPAVDVEFTGDLSFISPVLEGKTLRESEPFKSGIDFLDARYRMSITLFSLDDMPTLQKHIFDITVSYKDSVDTSYESRPFRFGDWENDASPYARVSTSAVSQVIRRV